MAQPTLRSVIAAGVEIAEIHRYDSSGYIAGITGTVAPGASAGAYRALGVQNASPTVPEPDIVTVPGDDIALGGFIFDSIDVPQFNMDFGTGDITLDAYMQSTLVFDDGDINMGALGPLGSTLVDAMAILTSQAKTYSAATKGTPLYSGVIVGKIQAKPLGRVAFEGRTAAVHRYACIVNQSTTWGLGATMKTTTHGTESTYIIPWRAQNRISMDRLTGDGATTLFTLAHKPAAATSAKVRVYVNGTLTTTGWTVSTANSTITFSPAPASAAAICILYEWVYS